MKANRNPSVFGTVFAHTTAGFRTGLGAVILIIFLAACAGGAAENSVPETTGAEAAATQPAEPTTAEQAPAAVSTEPVEQVMTEEPAAVEPTAVPQEAEAAPAGASVNACDILTTAEAEAYLGETPGAPESPVEGEGMYYVSSCSYKTDNNKISLIVTESVDQDPRVPAAAFESDLPKSVENFGVEAVEVPGLGDMAAWISNPDWYVNNLDVVKGPYRIFLSTGGEKSDQPPPALVDVAKMVLGKLS